MAIPKPFPAFAPLLRSLKFKFVAATILIVGVVISVSTWWNLQVHRTHMIKATEDRVRALADVIDRRIYTIMREGHIQDLQRTLEDAGQDPDIEQIMIFDLQGKVRRASRRQMIGAQYDRVKIQHFLDQPQTAVMEYYEDGRSIRTIVRQLRNGPECVRCHGTLAAVNGILHVDMSLRQTQTQIEEMERSALWTVLLAGVVLAGGAGFLMVRLVDRPLASLVRAMAKVEAGDLTVRASHASQDEIGRLGQSFNAMVDRLEAARAEIEAYHRGRLERAERLATMGELAASLAHEIKNPLAGIDGAIQVMADEMPDTDSRREIMLEVLSQVRRLDKTVRDLLAFARPGRPDVAPCDLHQVLDRTLLLVAGVPEARKVRVVRNYEASLPRFKADGKQLGQVFLNLVLNAIQAMPDGGQVRISTRLRGKGSDNGAGSLPAGPEVEVEVADNGPGIPAQLKEEIFKPFVTTKHRGTGLGLSVSRRIVEDHGGRITVSCPPEGGTIFRVLLPFGEREV